MRPAIQLKGHSLVCLAGGPRLLCGASGLDCMSCPHFGHRSISSADARAGSVVRSDVS